MTRKVTVLLDPQSLNQLRRLALEERRDIGSQARVLLEQGLAASPRVVGPGETSKDSVAMTAHQNEVTE